jgi:hypothetical protein
VLSSSGTLNAALGIPPWCYSLIHPTAGNWQAPSQAHLRRHSSLVPLNPSLSIGQLAGPFSSASARRHSSLVPLNPSLSIGQLAGPFSNITSRHHISPTRSILHNLQTRLDPFCENAAPAVSQDDIVNTQASTPLCVYAFTIVLRLPWRPTPFFSPLHVYTPRYYGKLFSSSWT